MTTQMLYDSKDVLLESYKAQESQGLTLESDGLLATFGERDFMSISCTMLEQSMDVYMFVGKRCDVHHYIHQCHARSGRSDA